MSGAAEEISDWDEIAPANVTPFPTAASAPPPAPPVEPPKRYRDAPAVVRKRDREPRGRDRRNDAGEVYVPKSGHAAAGPVVGRQLPHSIEAEEYLISSCMLDGPEIIPRCRDAGVEAPQLYDSNNSTLLQVIFDLHDAGKPTTIDVVAEELKTRRLLDQVGGYAFLSQVSQRSPTTAEARTFIRTVRQQALLRDIIRRATLAVENCYNFSGGDDAFAEIVAPIAKIPEAIEQLSTPLDLIAQPLADIRYPVNDPSVLIGTKHRWLCRGGAVLIPAPAGIGKSTLSYQSAACWGVGRNFLGLDCIRPLRILIVQAEDDDGDIGEVSASIVQGLKFTPREMDLFRRNVLVIRDKVNTGDAFIAALRGYVRAFRPDVVKINPLLAYCPGLSKEEIAGPFLYSGLNSVAASAPVPFAYIVYHHTPKPPAEQPTPRNGPRPAKSAVDRQYTAFGSSLLTNWARAIINISSVRGQHGQFMFTFDKRGTRAGLTREVSQGAGTRMESVTEFRAQHSTGRILVGDQEKRMILWERVEEKAGGEPSNGQTELAYQPSPSRRDKFTRAEIVELFPLGAAKALPIHQLKKLANDRLLMATSVFSDVRFNLLTEGVIRATPEGLYYRPEK